MCHHSTCVNGVKFSSILTFIRCMKVSGSTCLPLPDQVARTNPHEKALSITRNRASSCYRINGFGLDALGGLWIYDMFTTVLGYQELWGLRFTLYQFCLYKLSVFQPVHMAFVDFVLSIESCFSATIWNQHMKACYHMQMNV